MHSQTENPAAANCGAPKNDLAGCLIASEYIAPQLQLQIFCLARRFALAAPTAQTLAPLIYGEAWR